MVASSTKAACLLPLPKSNSRDQHCQPDGLQHSSQLDATQLNSSHRHRHRHRHRRRHRQPHHRPPHHRLGLKLNLSACACLVARAAAAAVVLAAGFSFSLFSCPTPIENGLRGCNGFVQVFVTGRRIHLRPNVLLIKGNRSVRSYRELES